MKLPLSVGIGRSLLKVPDADYSGLLVSREFTVQYEWLCYTNGTPSTVSIVGTHFILVISLLLTFTFIFNCSKYNNVVTCR